MNIFDTPFDYIYKHYVTLQLSVFKTIHVFQCIFAINSYCEHILLESLTFNFFHYFFNCFELNIYLRIYYFLLLQKEKKIFAAPHHPLNVYFQIQAQFKYFTFSKASFLKNMFCFLRCKNKIEKKFNESLLLLFTPSYPIFSSFMYSSLKTNGFPCFL